MKNSLKVTKLMRYGFAVLGALSLLILFPALGAVGSAFDLSASSRLQKGSFLVAAPKLQAPTFRRSVILLLEYGEGGALGLIINRPTKLPLNKVLSDLEGMEALSYSLYFGGPVSRHAILALLRSDDPPKEAHHVFEDIYFTRSLESLRQFLPEPDLDKHLRVYAGYAGWAPGQLENEVGRGDWVLVPAEKDAIFSDVPNQIWDSVFSFQEQIEI